MDWDVIRSRILIFLVADALGFVMFWVNRAIGGAGGRFEENILLTLGISNGIIILTLVAVAVLAIPVLLYRGMQSWLG